MSSCLHHYKLMIFFDMHPNFGSGSRQRANTFEDGKMCSKKQCERNSKLNETGWLFSFHFGPTTIWAHNWKSVETIVIKTNVIFYILKTRGTPPLPPTLATIGFKNNHKLDLEQEHVCESKRVSQGIPKVHPQS